MFSDGHDTGLYSWEYLHHLGMSQDAMWRGYLERLTKAGASRDPTTERPKSDNARPGNTQSEAPRPDPATGWKKL